MPAKDDFDRFRGIAEELGLEGDEGERFVNSSMKRKGYKPTVQWMDPEPENDGDGDDDFFTSRKKKRDEKQQQQQQNDGNGKASGSNWPYE